MDNANKVSSKYILPLLFAFLFCITTFESNSKYLITNRFHNLLTSFTDTILPGQKKLPVPTFRRPINADTINRKNKFDTIINRTDSIDLKLSKDSLDAVVEYNAEDSMVLDVPSKKITLYGKKATTLYKNNDLTAPVIEFDQSTGNIKASIKRDSTGKVISMPTFKQDDFTTQSDSLMFNMKTGKGLTKSSYTQQGEMYVYGEAIKKIDANVFYAKRGRFTTCDLDTPHFAFVSNRIKFITNKVAISGPVHPEFEGVPIPIYLPFGIYPLHQGRHSGFLAPQFTANQQLGLGLEGGGYYKVLSDYWDIILHGNIYSYGGWSATINPRYMKKYRYNGNLSLNIQHYNYNFKGDPDFLKNRSFLLQWSHNVDAKARPGVNFMASVNAGSSSFNSFIPNNPIRNFQNSLQSSIAYSKTWKDKPYNLTVTANHNQNTQRKLVNINLPDVAFNVNTLYPFRKKEAIGDLKWYENLGIAYNGNAKSLFSFYDTAGNILQHILDTFRWGARHSVPISLSLPQIGAFQLSPGVSYDETWYQKKIIKSWDDTKKKLDTTVTNGFYTARQMSFSLGISTRIFGMYTAKRTNAKVMAIRHEIRPSLGINYTPNMNKRNYYYTQIDTTQRLFSYSVFGDNYNVFQPYSNIRFGGMNFGVDNNLQMKVRNKKPARPGVRDSSEAGGDTGDNAFKKVTLIDGFSINSNYNFFLDSFKLSFINVNLRSTLFNKVNITAGALLDPYDVDADGNRLKTLLWRRKPLSFGRLLTGNVSISTQFQGGNKTAAKTSQQKLNNNPGQIGYTTDEYQNELAYIRNNPGEYADFNIPWSVNFSYALFFDRLFRPDLRAFKTNYSQNINFGGTLNLTPKWQIGLSGSYNITANQIGIIPVSISREMHCWQMSITLSPIGKYRYFSINISPKSALLRDIRVNRTRYFYDL